MVWWKWWWLAKMAVVVAGHNDDCDGNELLWRVAFASAQATFIAIAKGTTLQTMAGTFEVSKYELPSCSGFEKRLVKSGSIWCSAPRTTTSGCWAPSSPRACSRAGSTLWSASGREPGTRKTQASTWEAFLRTRWIDETLPEAQRTHKLTPWLGLNLATTWHLLHLLQIWPPDGATCNS